MKFGIITVIVGFITAQQTFYNQQLPWNTNVVSSNLQGQMLNLNDNEEQNTWNQDNKYSNSNLISLENGQQNRKQNFSQRSQSLNFVPQWTNQRVQTPIIIPLTTFSQFNDQNQIKKQRYFNKYQQNKNHRIQQEKRFDRRRQNDPRREHNYQNNHFYQMNNFNPHHTQIYNGVYGNDESKLFKRNNKREHGHHKNHHQEHRNSIVHKNHRYNRDQKKHKNHHSDNQNYRKEYHSLQLQPQKYEMRNNIPYYTNTNNHKTNSQQPTSININHNFPHFYPSIIPQNYGNNQLLSLNSAYYSLPKPSTYVFTQGVNPITLKKDNIQKISQTSKVLNLENTQNVNTQQRGRFNDVDNEIKNNAQFQTPATLYWFNNMNNIQN